jgi:uncharacterized membrane protein YdbT with pleckstrin-like domain
MKYVDENLIQGEKVAYRAPLHWKVAMGPMLLSILLLVGAFVLFDYAWPGTDNSRAFWIAGAVLLVLATIPILKARVAMSSAEFVVTNKRVILKTGFVHNKTAEMFLNKIESVGVDQTIMGRVFGYGSIVLRGTGGSLEPFSNVARPLEFRRQIQEQIGRMLEK